MKTLTERRMAAMRYFLTDVVGATVVAPRSYQERYPAYSETVELEQFIHTIPRDQLEVLVCLHLGMGPAEITKTLKYPSVVRYYNVSANLRRSFRERKEEYLAYN